MSLMRLIKQRAEAEYKARKQEAKRRLEAEREAFFAEHEELQEPLDELKSARYGLLLSVTEAAAFSQEEDKKAYRQKAKDRLAAAEANWEQQVAALAEKGEKMPEIRHFCPHCRDTGRVGEDLCPACYPAAIREVMQEIGISWLPEEGKNFTAFRLDIFSEEIVSLGGGRSSARVQMKNNLALMQHFVEHFSETDANYYFYGKTGTGKTFLASCAANALLDCGYIALLLPMMQFEECVSRLRTLQNMYRAKPEELAAAEEAYELLLEADLLVLDEFGLKAGLLHNPEAELMMLFQERRLRGGKTILTSNVGLKDLAAVYDERILSRVLEQFQAMPFLGGDLRLQRAKKR